MTDGQFKFGDRVTWRVRGETIFGVVIEAIHDEYRVRPVQPGLDYVIPGEDLTAVAHE